LTTTKYEKKIHLDQHSQSNLKRKKKTDHDSKTMHIDDECETIVGHKKVKVTDDNLEAQKLGMFCSQDNNDIIGKANSEQRDSVVREKVKLTENSGMDFDTYPVEDELSYSMQTESLRDEENTNKILNTSERKAEAPCTSEKKMEEPCTAEGQSQTSCLIRNSIWNFEEIFFPDMGSCQGDILMLSMPDPHLLPDGVCPRKLSFDVKKYWRQSAELKIKMKKNIFHRGEDLCVADLDFSYSEMTNRRKYRNAKNWQEYKAKVNEKEKNVKNHLLDSPAECLWKGEITPLVKPGDATSTGIYIHM